MTDKTLTEARKEIEQDLRIQPLMNSTDLMSNTMGMIEREASIAIVDKITGLLELIAEPA